MAAEEKPPVSKEEEELRRALACGEAMGATRLMRRVMRHLPSDPRCKMCFNPFAGVGGRILGLVGFAPSRKNPLFCNT
ncbi:MAG: hypothetical protein HYS09_00860 [Chloroflexi bacterium]|nr:hypothetical protein [Chloroflexota bacterium]